MFDGTGIVVPFVCFLQLFFLRLFTYEFDAFKKATHRPPNITEILLIVASFACMEIWDDKLTRDM